MEKQDLVNAISTLSGVVDALNRAGEKDDIKIVVAKIMELIRKI